MWNNLKKGVSLLLTASTLVAGMGMAPMDSAADTPNYRNVALRRAVYQSSAANYNDTGHLVTDGIRSQTDLWEPTISAQYTDSPDAEQPKAIQACSEYPDISVFQDIRKHVDYR